MWVFSQPRHGFYHAREASAIAHAGRAAGKDSVAQLRGILCKGAIA